MKNVLLTLAIGFVSTLGFSQNLENAVITYEQKINVHANLKGSQKAMKAFIPEFISSNLEMHLINGVARLKEVKKEQKSGIQISSSSADILMDLNTLTSKNFTKLGSEKYYTEEVFEKSDNIKFTDDTKVIGGYNCKSAIIKSQDEMEMTVWYTTELPAKLSPLGLIDIPGMVLEVESKKISFLFISIEKGNANKEILNIPDGYKKVNDDQLNDLTEEYMDEMMN